jgi:hypothetical protein
MFRYVAMNAKGENTRGDVELADKHALTEWLKQQQLFLVSCHEAVPETPQAPPEQTKVPWPEVPLPVQEDPRQEQPSRWPVRTPSQNVVLVVIFLACMLLGYLVGR